ncbi:MAG: cyclic nucleotide-binding domain-containing protein [Gammaproteobacteria bacterium]|nr:cyclic nucleotide-binding domain-containing protein [Gammaproteobacteria bacterium]
MNLNYLFPHAADVKTYQPGEVIFAEGAPADCLYVLLDGEVRLDSRGIEFWRVAPGEIFGEMALVDGRPRNSNAVAKAVSRVAPVDEKKFSAIVQHAPAFALMLVRTVARSLRATDETLAG